MTKTLPFPDSLGSLLGVPAGWAGRVPALPIAVDRDEAMRLLLPFHATEISGFAGPDADWRRAEQVHGNLVAIVPGAPEIPAPDGLPVAAGADGLVTISHGVVLTIYVADCGPIWLADKATGAVGLLHSGKKGTEGNILGQALAVMAECFGTRPENVTAVLGPCIRPPDYEVDIPAGIARQAAAAGLGNFHDCGLNTAADLENFYSYRRELGKTGRMMAMITRSPVSA